MIMMAYKFLKSRQLRELLDGAELKQKKDIHDYSGGHLNESILLKHYSASSRDSWETAHLPKPMTQRSQLRQQSPSNNRLHMKQALYDFSLGTEGVFPAKFKESKNLPQQTKKYKFLKEQSIKPLPKNEDTDSSSTESLYSKLEDGILLEELPASELMLKNAKDSPVLPSFKLKQELEVASGKLNATSTPVLDKQEHQSHHALPFIYNFLPMHNLGLTRRDQYRKMQEFETSMLKKKDATVKKVLSGVKAVEQHERKLQEELKQQNLKDIGVNFHKLQVYSNALENIIQESPTFSYILHCIKVEYDSYLAWLLDHHTSEGTLLREQVELMVVRGTSQPNKMAYAMEHVRELSEQAQSLLSKNQRLRDAVTNAREWLASAPDLTTESIQKSHSLLHRDQPLELADEIENLKAIILEKMDEENALRICLREKYVPMTVCTHLEQCIKETEVEVQKLLKQNEYYERSIDEMETELKEAIQDADTSEKDARRIWRKVNSTRGIPGHLTPGVRESEDEEEDEESKWNWYIS